MGLDRRVFIFEENGNVRRIPSEKYEAFLFHHEQFPEYANQKIRLVEVLLELKDQKPTGRIARTICFNAFCKKDGSLDTEKDWEGQHILAQVMSVHHGLYPTNVVPMPTKQAREKYKKDFLWHPTTAEKTQLSQILWSTN